MMTEDSRGTRDVFVTKTKTNDIRKTKTLSKLQLNKK